MVSPLDVTVSRVATLRSNQYGIGSGLPVQAESITCTIVIAFKCNTTLLYFQSISSESLTVQLSGLFACQLYHDNLCELWRRPLTRINWACWKADHSQAVVEQHYFNDRTDDWGLASTERLSELQIWGPIVGLFSAIVTVMVPWQLAFIDNSPFE